MSYASLGFIIFAAITVLLYFVVPQKYRWYVLLAASVVFYEVNSMLLSVFIVASSITLFLFAREIDAGNKLYASKKADLTKEVRKELKAKTEKKNKAFLVSAVLINAAILLVIKYFGFFVGTANSVLSLFGVQALSNPINIALPLGISYYTLTGISYITDVYRNKIEAENNPLKLFTFLSFFPHIVEGPFSRYGELSPRLFGGSKFDLERAKSGLIRLLWGFMKKIVLADRAAFAVNAVFAAPTDFTGGDALLAVLLYTFQIYAEFSGCMDIVCGISEILGISLAENFRQPFFSGSIDEFWRRWHITLGAWVKDYVFYPVSLSKASKKLSGACRKKLGSYYGMFVPVAYSLFFVWFFNGFWHGASWKFVFYGLYYYILMMFGRSLKPAFDKIKLNRSSKGYSVFSILRTDIIVFGGMLIFRSHDLKTAWHMLESVFTNFGFSEFFGGSIFKAEGFTAYDFIIIAIGFFVLLVVGILREKNFDIRGKIVGSHYIVSWAVILVICFVIIIFGIYGAGANTSFIYGQF